MKNLQYLFLALLVIGGNSGVHATIDSTDFEDLFNPNSFFTPLYLAAEGGDKEACERLLREEGVDVNEINRFDGATALHGAAGQGHTEICKLLIANGAQVEAQNQFFIITPLHLAAANGKVETCDFLIRAGANVNAKSVWFPNVTPLHVAACEGRKEVCQFLLKAGASRDMTALKNAAERYRVTDARMTAELYQQGIDFLEALFAENT